MSADIIPVTPCPHEKLNMTHNEHMERVYWCSGCGKKIAIPISTRAEMRQSELAGIIGLAFGEKWMREAIRAGEESDK